MAPEEPDDLPIYRVEFSDVAQTEAEAVYLRLSQIMSPEYAIQWYKGLLSETAQLSYMPRSHAIARENDRYAVEVRRMLYYGPSGRRRGGAIYRVLFHVIEPESGGEIAVVRILHVRHGARRPEE